MRTVSPLKLERVAEASQALSPGSQTVCPLWKQVLHPDQLQIPNPKTQIPSKKKLEQGHPGSESGLTKPMIDTGWFLLSRDGTDPHQSKVVKAEREKVGVRTGEKW